METPYDWITVGIFAGLIVLFMQRSTSDSGNDVNDPLWMYLAAGVGCAVANYVGNEGQHLLAILAIVGTLAFVFHYLKPFSWPKAD
ncbi:XrtV sorting system accessory protein [Sphingomonas humi]|uniref:Uncharacterized protein n=1 Tax=Sphingomonas humi TaxID=335630 RepID=A0ABP7RQJ3_9SPHN